jgi:hypothetical protein
LTVKLPFTTGISAPFSQFLDCDVVYGEKEVMVPFSTANVCGTKDVPVFNATITTLDEETSLYEETHTFLCGVALHLTL